MSWGLGSLRDGRCRIYVKCPETCLAIFYLIRLGIMFCHVNLSLCHDFYISSSRDISVSLRCDWCVEKPKCLKVKFPQVFIGCLGVTVNYPITSASFVASGKKQSRYTEIAHTTVATFALKEMESWWGLHTCMVQRGLYMFYHMSLRTSKEIPCVKSASRG